MATDPAPSAIHATAVAIGDRALVIRGPSKSGKSTLALDLIAASTTALPIILIGDDRVLVTRHDDGVSVAPHPRIAGLIEKRGEGILAMPYRTAVPVLGVVDLAAPPGTRDGYASTCDLAGENFPSFQFVTEGEWTLRWKRVLEWIGRDIGGTVRPKVRPEPNACLKD
jgi:HPr kinase/phosphorylase